MSEYVNFEQERVKRLGEDAARLHVLSPEIITPEQTESVRGSYHCERVQNVPLEFISHLHGVLLKDVDETRSRSLYPLGQCIDFSSAKGDQQDPAGSLVIQLVPTRITGSPPEEASLKVCTSQPGKDHKIPVQLWYQVTNRPGNRNIDITRREYAPASKPERVSEQFRYLMAMTKYFLGDAVDLKLLNVNKSS
jgi:hypothetical protein